MANLQYTIRNIPPTLDKVIRKKAQQTGKSFNQTVLDILLLQTFGTTTPKTDTSFSWLYNKNTIDDSFDETINNLSQVDETLWK